MAMVAKASFLLSGMGMLNVSYVAFRNIFDTQSNFERKNIPTL